MTIGRPKKDQNKANYYDSQFYQFVLNRFPSFVENGRIGVKAFSTAMDLTTFRVYTMFHENRISPKAAKKLIELSKNEKGDVVTAEELIPFLLN
jgi:hypothetical protein